jgi:hypothetical protein
MRPYGVSRGLAVPGFHQGTTLLRKVETEPDPQGLAVLTPGGRIVRAWGSTCGSRADAALRKKHKKPPSWERGCCRWVSGAFYPSSGRYFCSDSGVWNPD